MALSPARYLLLPVAVFAAVGGVGAWLGLSDAVSGVSAEVKLTGLLFAIGGVLMIFAAISLTRRPWFSKHGRIAVMLAGVSGALMGVYLLAMQANRPGPEQFERMAIWGVMVVATVLVAFRALHALRAVRATQATIRPLLKTLVSTVGVIGLLLGGVRWWYDNEYAPGAASPALTVSTELTGREPESPDESPRTYRAEISVKNTSKARVQVVSSLYQVDLVGNDPVAASADDEEADCYFERLSQVNQPQCPASDPNYRWIITDENRPSGAPAR
jgi:hypothetical protein